MNNASLITLIPEFDGTTDFLDFQSAVATTKAICGWTDAHTVQAIKLRLRGQALKFVQNSAKLRAVTGHNIVLQ